MTKNPHEGTLVMLACHGYYDAVADRFIADFPQDRPVYEAQLHYALQHVGWRAAENPLLVISGGMTRPPCDSEARGYLRLAELRGWKLPAEHALEELSLTSIENLLFSLYVYHRQRGCYPQQVEVISWEFKRRRFQQTLRAINAWAPLGETWPELDFFPVGDLAEPGRGQTMMREADYLSSLNSGLAGYYQNPRIQALMEQRDLHQSRQRARNFFATYPLPF